MSNRLDKEREAELTPIRINNAVRCIRDKKLFITAIDDTKVQFLFKGEVITIFPYSGWHSGKGIKAGRGLNNLLKQI